MSNKEKRTRLNQWKLEIARARIGHFTYSELISLLHDTDQFIKDCGYSDPATEYFLKRRNQYRDYLEYYRLSSPENTDFHDHTMTLDVIYTVNDGEAVSAKVKVPAWCDVSTISGRTEVRAEILDLFQDTFIKGLEFIVV